MDVDGLVVRDADLVTASGRLVRNQAGDCGAGAWPEGELGPHRAARPGGDAKPETTSTQE
jgi:hypothetical protein